MVARRKVTAAEKAELERVVREREEAQYPQFDIVIVVGDETNDEGKIPVNVTRNHRFVEDSIELYPKRR